MNIAREHARIELALDQYRKLLDTIPDDSFDLSPPGGGWSYAEVYSHIMQATLLSFISVDRCTDANCKPSSQGPNLLGKLLLLFGRFPPVKVKVPQAVASKMAPAKISKEEARNLIIKCRKRLEDGLAPIHDAVKNSPSKHPRLGMLNARQWLRFIRIHLFHHLKQIARIDKKLAGQ